MVRTVLLLSIVLMMPALAADAARMTYADARVVLDAFGASRPEAFAGMGPTEVAAAWPGWVARRDAEIRARLARGDEDSVVNFWMYGTSFTDEPSAETQDERVLRARLNDLISALQGPRQDERLEFARQVIARQTIDPRSERDAPRVTRYLTGLRRRMVDEFARSGRALAELKGANDPGAETAAAATIFRTRGLSSDTSILADFGVASALESIRRSGRLSPSSVRRVGIVGPGLDFTNKADGYDFYPVQTIQPFALADTLARLGLASPGMTITTFDLNERVNAHLRGAVARAAGGAEYVLTLPLDDGGEWTAPLEAFWAQLGRAIGRDDDAPPVPPGAGDVRVRRVRVRPDVARTLDPVALNIVFERMAALDPSDRFDLIVATNVLVYYDPFEQALALNNAASMLRPGGLLLTNTAVLPTPPLAASAEHVRVLYSTRQHDDLFWYHRE